MLPDAAWRGRAGLRRIVAALGADAVKIVGGAVRDTLLGLPVTDIDLAIDLIGKLVGNIAEAKAVLGSDRLAEAKARLLARSARG